MDDVEHLRAKAIASMPSSGNPSSSADVNRSAAAISVSDGGGGSKSKSHKSREEGEVSSSSDADLAISSVSQPNNTIQYVPVASKDKHLQKKEPAVKIPTAVRLSTSSMHFGSSVLQCNRKSYPKHFKRKQIPLRSAHNYARHWHAKSARNNLVISFSDDDSGSDSKEHIPEKDAKQISDLKHEPTPFVKKGCTTFSSVHRANVPTSGFQGPSAENVSTLQSQSPVVKEITNQELGQVQCSSVADQSLELLRGKIAPRDDRLKEQNNLALQNGATIVSASKQHGTCAMKPENHEDLGKNADETILRFGVDEPSKKRLKLEKSSSAPYFDMSSKLEDWKKCLAESSCSHHDSVPENLKESAASKYKSPFESFERISKRNETINQPTGNVDSMHLMLRNQLMTSKIEVGMSAEPLYVKEKSSECGSGNNEVNILESGCMQLQSLVKLEELHDKELEEAQEHRRMCELEERCSLRAYRKAQRALVAANERCNLLYQKREQFSTKFSAFFMKTSNSVCPSNWLRQESPQEDQLCDPDASTSVQQDYSALDGAVPHVHNLNMSTDDDEENFPSSSRFIESKSALVNFGNGKEPSLDNSPDYELLEASLRSKLVARMGIRASPKVNDTCKGGNVVGKRIGGIAEVKNPLLIKNMLNSEKKQTCSKGDPSNQLVFIGRKKAKEPAGCLVHHPSVSRMSRFYLQQMGNFK
ncbi:hypothetical protein HPP92_018997 [Vanilla planifolia]|uniref:Uncharacterized protein n=1 Tax=Vanilla planifolia TaxID=51239 RepID=A0A835QE00_VANPL|nr:hypothetical protein HPP92_018997 [Vanilla planifolia]